MFEKIIRKGTDYFNPNTILIITSSPIIASDHNYDHNHCEYKLSVGLFTKRKVVIGI